MIKHIFGEHYIIFNQEKNSNTNIKRNYNFYKTHTIIKLKIMLIVNITYNNIRLLHKKKYMI